MSPEETSLQSVLAGIGGGRLRVLSLPMKGGVCAEVPAMLAVDELGAPATRSRGLSAPLRRCVELRESVTAVNVARTMGRYDATFRTAED